MATKPPDWVGLGGYGPWPENDKPFVETPPGGDYIGDGYANRAPAGCHTQSGTDYWLDCALYPERTYAFGDEQADSLDRESRNFKITVGSLTGKKPGPVN